MNETLPFAALDQFLQNLGFEKIVVPKSHIGYRHDDSDTIFMSASTNRTTRSTG